MVQLFTALDRCPTFTIVNQQGQFAAGTDGKARFFIACDEATEQLAAINARGGVDLRLHVVGLGRAVALSAQGKGVVIGRTECAACARAIPPKEGEPGWTIEAGLPLFYAPVLMAQARDGTHMRPLFVDSADAASALEHAKAQIARDQADVPAEAMELHVVSMQHVMKIMLEGKARDSVIQPSSRALKVISELKAAERKAAKDAEKGTEQDTEPPAAYVTGYVEVD